MTKRQDSQAPVQNLELETENESLRNEVQELKDALERSNQERGSLERLRQDFVTLISHELRTPLTSIVGMSELILGGHHKSRQDLLEMMRTIADESMRLSEFVDDTVEFLQWMCRHVTLRMQIADLRQILEDVLRKLGISLVAKKIRLSLKGDPYAEIIADVRCLSMCLERILGNAMANSQPGGNVDVEIETTVDEAETAWAVVKVHDRGDGLTSDRLADLRALLGGVRAPLEPVLGAGLWLVIVREAISAHDGQVSLDSPGPGQGSTMTLRIPLAQRAGLGKLGKAWNPR